MSFPCYEGLQTIHSFSENLETFVTQGIQRNVLFKFSGKTLLYRMQSILLWVCTLLRHFPSNPLKKKTLKVNANVIKLRFPNYHYFQRLKNHCNIYNHNYGTYSGKLKIQIIYSIWFTTCKCMYNVPITNKVLSQLHVYKDHIFCFPSFVCVLSV